MQYPIEGHRIKCRFCKEFFVICSSCYRGQAYCSPECQSTTRKQRNQTSVKAYQSTFRGKRLHAARQQRYREKIAQEKKVTHQASEIRTRDVESHGENYFPIKKTAKTPLKRCVRCHVYVQAFLLPKLQSQKRRNPRWTTIPSWSPK